MNEEIKGEFLYQGKHTTSQVPYIKDYFTNLLLNENFSMIMKGADASDFIFFNRDWTLDRMPKYIELTEDDKEYLKKFVRPNQYNLKASFPV